MMDIDHFFHEEGGQIAIYDAVNPLAKGRQKLVEQFREKEIQVICALEAVQLSTPNETYSDHFHRIVC